MRNPNILSYYYYYRIYIALAACTAPYNIKGVRTVTILYKRVRRALLVWAYNLINTYILIVIPLWKTIARRGPTMVWFLTKSRSWRNSDVLKSKILLSYVNISEICILNPSLPKLLHLQYITKICKRSNITIAKLTYFRYTL